MDCRYLQDATKPQKQDHGWFDRSREGPYSRIRLRTVEDEGRRSDITRLLQEWQAGSAQALDRLIPLVYNELHTLASRYLSRERSDHTLQPTALVNEAYLKLVGQRAVDWQNRSHFFGIAAQLMRRIIVDHARHDGRFKRGGGVAKISIDDADPAAPAAQLIPLTPSSSIRR